MGNASTHGLELDLGEACDDLCTRHRNNATWLTRACFAAMVAQRPIRDFARDALGCTRNVTSCIKGHFAIEDGDAGDNNNDYYEDYYYDWENETKINRTYKCHELMADASHFMNFAQFWLEGVFLLVVGIFGIAGNAMTLVVLRRIDSNATFSFNRLLMTLAIVDASLLVYYVLDYGVVGVFMRSERLPEPLWYRLLFPYVLHPLKGFCISASIFMVVAISAERHRAICSPLTHRPAFWPYAAIVFCVSGESGLGMGTRCRTVRRTRTITEVRTRVLKRLNLRTVRTT